MGKKSRRFPVATVEPLPAGAEIPAVGGREPCPCGSGKRYKACHGRAALAEAARLIVRPFEGLPGECDVVAMREIVPAATATARLAGPMVGEHAGSDITMVTVLPMAWPAMRRADGMVALGLQSMVPVCDPSRAAAAALLAALAAEPGTPVLDDVHDSAGPRLQDLLDHDTSFTVTVHDGFGFWMDASQEMTAEVRGSLERANAAAIPTRRLNSVTAAYWCRIGERRHLRWVLPFPEADIVDAIARLHAAGVSDVGPGTRYVGSFRAHGLLVPVWDLAVDTEAEDLEAPALAFEKRLGEAMASTSPLTPEERRARAGVASRQLTLR